MVAAFDDELLTLTAERAHDANEAGRLDDDVAARFAPAGINRALLPEALGGDQLDPGALYEMVARIGEVDGSTAWCAAISAGSGVFSGYISESGAREVFTDPDAGNAAMFAPAGVAVRANGKATAVLNGRWPFVSNCQHAQAIGLGAFVQNADGEHEPIPRLVVVPADAVVIEPTWVSAGLRATGSHHVRVENVEFDLARACTFGDTPWPSGALWNTPLFSVLGPVLVAAPMGVARGAIAEVQRMVVDGAGGMRGTLADDPVALAELAATESALRAAEAGLLHATALIWERASAGERASRQLQARAFLSVHHALDTAVHATSEAHRLAGGSAAYLGHPLLDRLADVQAARQHIMFAHLHRPALERIAAGIDQIAPPFVL